MRHLRAIFAVAFLSALACCSVFGVVWRQEKESGRILPREQSAASLSPAYLKKIDIAGTPRSGPAVGQNGTIYIEVVSSDVSQTLFLNAVNPAGQIKWRVALPAYTFPRRPPAIGLDGTIYVTGGDGFVAFCGQRKGFTNLSEAFFHVQSGRQDAAKQARAQGEVSQVTCTLRALAGRTKSPFGSRVRMRPSA